MMDRRWHGGEVEKGAEQMGMALASKGFVVEDGMTQVVVRPLDPLPRRRTFCEVAGRDGIVPSHHRGKQCSAVALGTDTTGAGWWMEAARI